MITPRSDRREKTRLFSGRARVGRVRAHWNRPIINARETIISYGVRDTRAQKRCTRVCILRVRRVSAGEKSPVPPFGTPRVRTVRRDSGEKRRGGGRGGGIGREKTNITPVIYGWSNFCFERFTAGGDARGCVCVCTLRGGNRAKKLVSYLHRRRSRKRRAERGWAARSEHACLNKRESSRV